ncbi:hypothetical protein CEXT_51331 [Caerostris extrusa]|uniref:Uncharacterized protein n=1 Tax=Caerostris extrusa TaxID=172846 RepID=A0AAV4MNB0_CAEEX|nr:hypothetical protein CEXT_51331 [Caerostris extrusa]
MNEYPKACPMHELRLHLKEKKDFPDYSFIVIVYCIDEKGLLDTGTFWTKHRYCISIAWEFSGQRSDCANFRHINFLGCIQLLVIILDNHTSWATHATCVNSCSGLLGYAQVVPIQDTDPFGAQHR